VEEGHVERNRFGLSPKATKLIYIIVCIFVVATGAVVLGLIPVYIGVGSSVATTSTTTMTTTISTTTMTGTTTLYTGTTVTAAGSALATAITAAGSTNRQAAATLATVTTTDSTGRLLASESLACNGAGGTQNIGQLRTKAHDRMFQQAIRACLTEVEVVASCVSSLVGTVRTKVVTYTVNITMVSPNVSCTLNDTNRAYGNTATLFSEDVIVQDPTASVTFIFDFETTPLFSSGYTTYFKDDIEITEISNDCASINSISLETCSREITQPITSTMDPNETTEEETTVLY